MIDRDIALTISEHKNYAYEPRFGVIRGFYKMVTKDHFLLY